MKVKDTLPPRIVRAMNRHRLVAPMLLWFFNAMLAYLANGRVLTSATLLMWLGLVFYVVMIWVMIMIADRAYVRLQGIRKNLRDEHLENEEWFRAKMIAHKRERGW